MPDTELILVSLAAYHWMMGIEEPHLSLEGGRGCPLEEVLSPHVKKWDVGCAEWQLPYHCWAPGRSY